MAEIRREPARRRAAEYAGLVLSVIVLAAGLTAIVARPVTASQFATLHPITGTVEVARGGDAFGSGSEGATLREGDVIRTGDDGSAEIEFFDGSVTVLDRDTTVSLERVADIEDTPGSKLIESDVQSGRTFHQVQDSRDPDSYFEVEAGGTVAVGEGAFVVSRLLTGLVAVWVLPDGQPEVGTVSLELEDEGRLRVGEGQGATVFKTGRLGAPFRLTDAHLTDEWVRSNLCSEAPELELCAPPEETPTPKPAPQRPPPKEQPTDAQPSAEGEAPIEGEVAPAAPLAFVTVAAAPEVDVIGGPRRVVDAKRARFRFASAGPVAFFECSLDGGGFRRCESPQRYRDLTDGTHVVLIRAVDPSGNPGPVARRRWRVDTAAPDTVISGPTLISGGTQALFAFESSERGSTFRCALDGGPFLACASPAEYAGLGPGLHTFQVRARDRAGNVDPTPATFSWTAEGVASFSVRVVTEARASQDRAEERPPTVGGSGGGSADGPQVHTSSVVDEVGSLSPPTSQADIGGVTGDVLASSESVSRSIGL
ncbi:MAG TPA: FecR domain-containing protein [Actinomycetota bacterium]|nr:FecR domain-containing protein [Actinomycetota bacterium]